jgi:hypothetical protein
MISISRSPAATVALVLTVTLVSMATVATAHNHHDHHHHHHDHDGDAWRWGLWKDGKQTQVEAFNDCLCWNKTSDNWCHHEHDGKHTGFWRDSCQRVVGVNTMWWVPALLWILYLSLMPLCMCAFRLCCNCCGGRTPSFGCCCPISNKVLSPDPKWVRPYSRCATWTAKILAVIVFVIFFALSVASYHGTAKVSHAVEQAASAAQADVDATIMEINSLATQAKKYAAEPWMGVDANMIDTVQSAIPTLTQASKDISHIPKHVEHHHRSAVLAFISVPLIIVIIVTALGLCNVRSWPISISAGLLSFMTIGLVVVGCAIMSVSVATHLVCDNAQTVTTFAEDVLESKGYCNQQRLTTAVNNTQIAYARTLCMNGLQTMIAAAPAKTQPGGAGFCEEKIGGMFRQSYPVDPFVMQGYKIVDRLRLWNIIADSTLAQTKDGSSILACSKAAGCSEHTQCAKIVEGANFVFGPSKDSLGDSLNSLMIKNSKCQIVAQQMQTIVQPILCSVSSSNEVSNINLGFNIHKLGSHLLALAFVATVAFWVWMNGSKRFTKSASKEELLGHHEMQRQHMAALQYYQQPENVKQAAQVPQGVYDNGVNGPQPVATAAVAATTEQPLLLHHNAPTYTNGSVNNRQAQDVDLPVVKQQPEPI